MLDVLASRLAAVPQRRIARLCHHLLDDGEKIEMDETDGIAAATLVAAMLNRDHPRVQVPDKGNMWPTIAKMCMDCAQALATERHNRQSQWGG